MRRNDKQASLRLPQDLFDRAEALVPTLQEDPAYRFVPVIGVSHVLRLALELGLRALEQQYPRKGA